MKKALVAVIFVFLFILSGCSSKPEQAFVDELNNKTDYKNTDISEYKIADSYLYINGGVKVNDKVSPNYYLWQTDKIYLAESVNALTIYYLDANSVMEYANESTADNYDYNKLINNLLNRDDFTLDDFDYESRTYTLKEEYLQEFYKENDIPSVDNLQVSFYYKKEIKTLHVSYQDNVDIIISFTSGAVTMVNIYVKESNMEINFSGSVSDKVIKSLTIEGFYEDKSFTGYTEEDVKGRIASSNLHSKEEKNSVSAIMLIKAYFNVEG